MTRELRRLTHSSVVPTTYANRDSETDVLQSRHSKAVSQGYDEGYAQGLAQARVDADRERGEEASRVEAAIAGLNKAIAAMQEADLHLRSEIQKSAPRLAFALLEQLLDRELEVATNPGREAIVRTLALEDGTLPATVRMNPADIERLGQIAEFALGREVFLLADPQIHIGGALVEIGNTTLDGQIDTALERVKKILFAPIEVDENYDQAV